MLAALYNRTYQMRFNHFSLFFYCVFFLIEITEFSIRVQESQVRVSGRKNVRRRPNAVRWLSLFLFDGVNEVSATENAQVIIADVIISNSVS